MPLCPLVTVESIDVPSPCATSFVLVDRTMNVLVVCGCETWFCHIKARAYFAHLERLKTVLSSVILDLKGRSQGGWSKLHHEESRVLCPSPYIVRVNKCRRIR
jgi:hypothetical protein